MSWFSQLSKELEYMLGHVSLSKEIGGVWLEERLISRKYWCDSLCLTPGGRGNAISLLESSTLFHYGDQ